MRATWVLRRSLPAECESHPGRREPAKYLRRYVYRKPPPWSSDRLTSPSKKLINTFKPRGETRSWPKIDTNPIPLNPVNVKQRVKVPHLAHGLNRVLHDGKLHAIYGVGDEKKFGPARHTDYFRKILPPEMIAWDRMAKYVSAKHDTQLHKLATTLPGVQYVTSTSSISPTFSNLYHFISNFRQCNLVGGLSRNLFELPSHFAKYTRLPNAVDVTPVVMDGKTVFSVSNHEAPGSNNTILLELGNSIERMLTHEPDEFMKRYVLDEVQGNGKGEKTKTSNDWTCEKEQFYNYSVANSMLMRSQIDCRDVDDKFVFDLKTRAVQPIRYDIANYRENNNWKVTSLRGLSSSYEREFHDMVRTVFIKYALQLRIGRMDGALVAYHNTTELLALEYISLKEIESYVYGSSTWADVAFSVSVRLFELIMDRIQEAMFAEGQQETVKVLFSTDRNKHRLTVFAQRLRKDEEDPLGFEAFRKSFDEMMEKNLHHEDRFRPVGSHHVDSQIHSTDRPGLAVVGSAKEILELGGEKVKFNPKGTLKQMDSGKIVFSSKSYDTSKLTTGEFYVWEVDVAPTINGVQSPKGHFDVTDASDFELRYNIRQVKEISEYVMNLYCHELARLYLWHST